MPTFARGRIMDRLKELEARLRPPARQFVFYYVEPNPRSRLEPDPRSRAEQLEAFKAENNVGPNDVLHTVTMRFV
jgi:hypothetical protein